MAEKRMLIVDAETVKRIEENRGDMSVSEFLNYIIDGHLDQVPATHHGEPVTREEFQHFEEGIRDLLRSFLEFFLSYGLELGKHPTDGELNKLNLTLQGLSKSTKPKKY
jgi:hypothetical protein